MRRAARRPPRLGTFGEPDREAERDESRDRDQQPRPTRQAAAGRPPMLTPTAHKLTVRVDTHQQPAQPEDRTASAPTHREHAYQSARERIDVKPANAVRREPRAGRRHDSRPRGVQKRCRRPRIQSPPLPWSPVAGQSRRCLPEPILGTTRQLESGALDVDAGNLVLARARDTPQEASKLERPSSAPRMLLIVYALRQLAEPRPREGGPREKWSRERPAIKHVCVDDVPAVVGIGGLAHYAVATETFG
jgi:hypothetical protein